METIRFRWRTRRCAIAPYLLALAVLAGGCTRSRPGDVVLVVVDTLRADHLGLYGYPRETTPNLERWFGEGAVFLRSYAASTTTAPSVASLLTGLQPTEHRVRLLFQRLPDDVELLTQHLPASYQSAAFVSNVVLTEEALGLASRFDHYDDFVDEQEAHRLVFERGAERTTDAVLEHLSTAVDPERPLFLWVHYIDPHGPYLPPASWRERFSHEASAPIEGSMPPYQVDPEVDDAFEYVDRYDEEIAYVDREIGRLLDGYAAVRDADRALLVLTADHGETLMERKAWFLHGYGVFEEQLRVPLLLRGPGVVPGRFAAPVSGIDLAPTILGFAGVKVPDAMSGRDLRRGDELPAQRLLQAEATGKKRQWRAAIYGDVKAEMTVRGREGRIESRRFYDLERDPDEKQPRRWNASDGLAQWLEEAVRSDPDPAGIEEGLRGGMQITAPKVAPGVSPENQERLRALGYAE